MSEILCNVALAVPLRTTFSYAVPATLRDAVQPGSRVLVPFRKKTMVGVIVDLPARPPEKTKIREISQVLDAIPALTASMIELGRWIAGYYLAPVGEVFRAMLPPVTEVRSQQQIVITEAGRQFVNSQAAKLGSDFNPEEIALLSKVIAKQGSLAATSLAKFGLNAALLQRLNRRGFVDIRQNLLERKQKTQAILAWRSEASPQSAAVPQKTPPRQGKTLERFQQQVLRVQELLQAERGPLPLPQLLTLAEVSRAAIDRMLAEGLLDSWQEPVDPAEDPFDVGYAPPAHELNPEQDYALKRIRARFELGEFGVQLLYGVTGSGKTEVYLRAIQETLARQKTALVLVPEIALTLWIGRQCRAWFGARFEGVAVLHSALTDVERAREWWRVRNGEARVVVGTRSAVFAPVDRLGLIIVDEEQENSYKQEETPRYHGRDVAIVRAKMENAVALLGSATPSLETYHHAVTGKYELLTLASRVENRSLANVEVVDLREEFQQTHQAGSISSALHSGIQECLNAGTQALVLINRR